MISTAARCSLVCEQQQQQQRRRQQQQQLGESVPQKPAVPKVKKQLHALHCSTEHFQR
jgi:hypothetical protein